MQKPLKQYNEAIEDYNQAIELDSQFVAAYYGRGYAKNHLNQFQEAIKEVLIKLLN